KERDIQGEVTIRAVPLIARFRSFMKRVLSFREAAMKWYWFWAGAALLFWLCRHYSFWVVFGWAYAFASVVLIMVCFTHNRRSTREIFVAHKELMQSQPSELETNE
ncbi:MAG: hypothetical protein ACYC9I_13230, partial [Desulfuromonadales bacterium]